MTFSKKLLTSLSVVSLIAASSLLSHSSFGMSDDEDSPRTSMPPQPINPASDEQYPSQVISGTVDLSSLESEISLTTDRVNSLLGMPSPAAAPVESEDNDLIPTVPTRKTPQDYVDESGIYLFKAFPSWLVARITDGSIDSTFPSCLKQKVGGRNQKPIARLLMLNLLDEKFVRNMIQTAHSSVNWVDAQEAALKMHVNSNITKDRLLEELISADVISRGKTPEIKQACTHPRSTTWGLLKLSEGAFKDQTATTLFALSQ